MAYDPFVGPNPVVRNLQRMQARLDQVRENSAREAHCYATLTSVGHGEVVVPEVIDFGATFLRRPDVSHGYTVQGKEDLSTAELVDGRLPKAWGGVRGWQRNTQGWFTGCWVFLVVDDGAIFDEENSDYANLKHYETAEEATAQLTFLKQTGSTGQEIAAAENAIARAQRLYTQQMTLTNYTVLHDFRFSGIAVKDLPAYLFDQ